LRKQNHSPNQFWHKWLNSLKRLWRSLVNSLKVLFSGNSDGDSNSRSPRSRQSSQSTLNSEGVIVIPRPAPFLLGLDDLPNLESLTTKEFIDQIAWNVEGSEILLAKEEDLNLLEDLLVNFPES
jgi:hypothetical protein